jgi:hypothetical protein
MRRLLLFSLAVAAALPATASATTKPVPLPEGAAISDSLEYLGRVESPGLVEGKLDEVWGRRVLITTGRFGFRTYDASDPAKPKLLDTFRPPDILGENGYWQDEDMDIDTRRKADHRRTRSSSRRRPSEPMPRHRERHARAAAGQQDPPGGMPERLLRHLLRQPAQPAPDRRLRRAARRPHGELHRPLQLRLDGRAGPPQRPRIPRAVHARSAR